MRLPRMTTRRWMTVVVVAGLLMGWIVWHIRHPGRAFDAAAWNDLAQIDRGVRQSMADRMIAWGSLRGMTRAQVIRLLGEPLAGSLSGWDLAYYIGPERGFFSIDSECLVIRLGPDGRVIACSIYTD